MQANYFSREPTKESISDTTLACRQMTSDIKYNLTLTKDLKKGLETEEMFRQYGDCSDMSGKGTLLEVLDNFRMHFLGTQLSEPFEFLPKLPDLGLK